MIENILLIFGLASNNLVNQVLMGLGFGLITLFPVYIIGGLLGKITYSIGTLKDWFDGLVLTCSGLITATSEEVIFRGGIMHLLFYVLGVIMVIGQFDTGLAVDASVFITALLFSWAHFKYGMYKGEDALSPKGLGLAILGIILGCSVAITGNIWTGVGIHWGWITVVSIMPNWFKAKVDKGWTEWFNETHPVVGTIGGILAAIFAWITLRDYFKKSS